ncbi:hypothetical protein [Burkholderia phage vB_BglM_WTB]
MKVKARYLNAGDTIRDILGREAIVRGIERGMTGFFDTVLYITYVQGKDNRIACNSSEEFEVEGNYSFDF